MVWSFKYQPSGSSYPNADVVEGPRGFPELVDTTRDGGTSFIRGAQHFAGRRINPESVPKVVQFLSRRSLQDLEGQFVHTVSDRLRTLIEELEPQVHQFEPIDYIAKDGSPLERRWFWQICNRLDTVHRELTVWTLDGPSWRPPAGWDKKAHLIFDLSKIGGVKFWHDKHVSSASFCSDDVRERFDADGITGVRYRYYEQA